jgi:hypothetical protein
LILHLRAREKKKEKKKKKKKKEKRKKKKEKRKKKKKNGYYGLNWNIGFSDRNLNFSDFGRHQLLWSGLGHRRF